MRHRNHATVAALLLAVIVGSVASCALYTPTGERPLTLREKVYQVGGVLVGLGQELEFAIQMGTLKGEPANKLVTAYDAAFQFYRHTARIAIAGTQADADKARLDLIRLVDQLRRDFTAALVKP